METHNIKFQSGYALLLAVLAFMGISGAVAVGYTQQARQDMEQERYLHNKRVLEEAKRALLLYAYNYPGISLAAGGPARGPGRLPCTDTDNDGDSNTLFGDCDAVGRFPWAEPALGINDLRDADGQRLWYTVSSTFANATSTIVNSDTSGTLTVRTPEGNIMYDGSNPDSLVNHGIAAVIIAPGAAIGRNGGVAQNRSVGNGDNPFDTTLDTDPGIIDPVNYLDQMIAGVEDNATVNQGSAGDGFFLGGKGYQSTENVNDQFILVTAEEVSAIAERAVLEAYRDAIDDYQQNVWASAADYRYPWLNEYVNIADLNIYDLPLPPTGTGRVGRVPFLNYYADHDSHVLITDLQMDFEVALTYTSLFDNNEAIPGYIDVFGNMFTSFPAGVQTLSISRSNLSFEKKTFDGVTDNTTDFRGTMVATTGGTAIVTAAPSSPLTRYFWDGCSTCPQVLPTDGWEECPFINGNETDCARTPAGGAFQQPFAGWANHADIIIRVVTLRLDIDPEFVIELDTSAVPVSVTYTAPVATHAAFTTTFNANEVTELTVADNVETNTRNFFDLTVVMCEQDNNVTNFFNIPSSNPDPDSALCTLDLAAIAGYTLSNQVQITADYYPELPIWVSANNWNSSFLMAYAADYQPGSPSLPPNCGVTPPCLTVIDDYAGETDNNGSLLLSAGRIPANIGDLLTIFEGENSPPFDNIFAAHPNGGDDAMLILDDI